MASLAKDILIIEDNQSDMMLLKSSLKGQFPELKITEVTSLSEAYENHRTKRYDVILVDLNLPDGFGLATIKEVRRYMGDQPVIAVTGMMTETIEEKAAQMGASGVFSKDDIQNQKFFDTINRITSA